MAAAIERALARLPARDSVRVSAPGPHVQIPPPALDGILNRLFAALTRGDGPLDVCTQVGLGEARLLLHADVEHEPVDDLAVTLFAYGARVSAVDTTTLCLTLPLAPHEKAS